VERLEVGFVHRHIFQLKAAMMREITKKNYNNLASTVSAKS
jgi:hypothetical protein